MTFLMPQAECVHAFHQDASPSAPLTCPTRTFSMVELSWARQHVWPLPTARQGQPFHSTHPTPLLLSPQTCL